MLHRMADLASSERYHLMTQALVPRAIAWALTDNGAEFAEQRFNLAPFSYFTAISSEPPVVMISVGSKPEGVVKDTRRNLIERQHAVLHIPSSIHAAAVTQSAATLDFGVSEVAAGKLPLVSQEGWPLPRLADCAIAMACRLYDHLEVGPERQGVLFMEIDELWVSDAVLSTDAKGRQLIDAMKLDPLARLGANQYATLGGVITLARPK